MVTFDNETNSASDPELTIRRIAILLRSLPTRTHRALLGQLTSEARKRVSDALDDLGDVDVMEQHRVLVSMHEQLHAETDRMKSVESEIQDEIFIGKARVAKKPATAIHRQADRPTKEMPQVESHSHTAVTRDSAGVTEQSEIPLHSEHQASSLMGFSGDSHAANAEQNRATADEPEVLLRLNATDAVRFLSAGHGGGDFDVPLPLSRDMASHDTKRPVVPLHRGPAVRGGETMQAAVASDNTHAERVDRILEQLRPKQICQALGLVTAKQAFLVLCGLPNETAEAVLALLPRRKAKQVRADMRRIGKLQLTEIDAAKEVVVEVAMRMTLGQEAA